MRHKRELMWWLAACAAGVGLSTVAGGFIGPIIALFVLVLLAGAVLIEFEWPQAVAAEEGAEEDYPDVEAEEDYADGETAHVEAVTDPEPTATSEAEAEAVVLAGAQATPDAGAAEADVAETVAAETDTAEVAAAADDIAEPPVAVRGEVVTDAEPEPMADPDHLVDAYHSDDDVALAAEALGAVKATASA